MRCGEHTDNRNNRGAGSPGSPIFNQPNFFAMSKIDWPTALASRGQWAGVGNIREIFRPCRDLLSRWQKAYQAANNLSKRPNLTEAVTYALVMAHPLLLKECVRLEAKVAEQQELENLTKAAAAAANQQTNEQ